MPSSLGLLSIFSVFFSHLFSFPPARYTLISIFASSQVNASRCSLLYTSNEQLISAKFSRPFLTEPPSKVRKWRVRRTFFSFKILINDFHEQNNLFHLSSICCKHWHLCYNYIGFASVRNSHRTLQLAVEKQYFLLKCRFTISREHNNSFHLNFISKLQT